MDNPQTLAKLGTRQRKKTNKIKNITQKTKKKPHQKNHLEIEQNIGILELLYQETCFNRIVEFTVVWIMSVNVYSNKRYCSINLK